MKKKLMSVLLIAFVLCGLCACGSKGDSAAPAAPAEVELTKDNVGNYLTFKATFTNGDYHNVLGITNVANADMEVEVYSTSAGTYDNVEVTLKANMTGEDNYSMVDNWHLKDTEDKDITITFKMPASGEYKTTYPVECDGSTQKLSGVRDFTVVSVSGTFIPNN